MAFRVKKTKKRACVWIAKLKNKLRGKKIKRSVEIMVICFLFQ